MDHHAHQAAFRGGFLRGWKDERERHTGIARPRSNTSAPFKAGFHAGAAQARRSDNFYDTFVVAAYNRAYKHKADWL